MNDFRREAATAAADGSRDAAALVLAMLDHDDVARDAILFNADALQVAVSLAALVLTAVPDRAELDRWLAAWRQAAASTEGETS